MARDQLCNNNNNNKQSDYMTHNGLKPQAGKVG